MIMIFEVRGNSLTGILNSGTQVKLLNRHFEKNDNVIFQIGNQLSIKRIVAIPGETLDCERTLILNGFDTTLDPGILRLYWKESAIIPESCYVVLGTQPNSRDSRMIGYVHVSDILGPVSPI